MRTVLGAGAIALHPVRTPLQHLTALFTHHNVRAPGAGRRCAPARGMRVGTLSRHDPLAGLLRPDEEIRRLVEREVFLRALGANLAGVRIGVTGGVVTLTGWLPYRSDVVIAEELTGQVIGTSGVRNRLRYGWDDLRP
ncbi:BON domain-containing protein [Amycolatopsis anabasis]|uniref:BON domain-containing protein n=1 Tax=Amycolatopsis anabasis TaxID=1840409 RepID=UPI00131CF704|nr:BON domain-containing protein [Amycolatopsis anabasis]